MRGCALALVALAACSGDDGNPGQDFGSTGGPFFTQPMFFNRDVSSAPKAADSSAVISALRAAGGWGNGDKMQIDFSIDVLGADASTTKRSFNATDDFYDPDCDQASVPVPS